MPPVAELEAIIDRLKWSLDHLQKMKFRMLEEGVAYHWMPVTKTDAQGRSYREFVIDQATPLPDGLEFIVGDCIHSLRASLDNLIYTLCPTDYAEFPICKTPDKWEKDLWKIEALSPAVRAILKDLQPFQPQHAGDPEGCPLWILDRLWNDDKHRAPHLVMGVSASSSISGDEWWHAVTCLGGPLEIGSVVAKVWFFPDTEPELIANFGFDVAFEAMGPARGRGVYYCLSDLHERVGEVVEKFQPFFTD